MDCTATFFSYATQYVKGLKIRLYFASTMGLAGVSVIFKHIAGDYKSVYSSALNGWVKDNPAFIEWAKTEGAMLGSAKVQVRDWILSNKDAVKGWLVQQSEAFQYARAMEKMWNDYSGYLMLGAAVGLSILIIQKMLQGVAYEKKVAVQSKATAEE